MNLTQSQAHSHTKKSIGIATNLSVSVCSRLEKVKATIKRPWPKLCRETEERSSVCSSDKARVIFKTQWISFHEERTHYSFPLFSRNIQSFFQSKEWVSRWKSTTTATPTDLAQTSRWSKTRSSEAQSFPVRLTSSYLSVFLTLDLGTSASLKLPLVLRKASTQSTKRWKRCEQKGICT